MRERAAVFIDGNNWYRGLRAVGVEHPGRLDYRRLTEKLAGTRSWVSTRYYVGRIPQGGDRRLYAAQRKFLGRMVRLDPRITVRFGRLEQRIVRSPMARELRSYLAHLSRRIDVGIFRDLLEITKRHEATSIVVEKAVDVMLAIDMVVMAVEDRYDTAYLLSADGDFTPAVEAVRARGKRVFAVSPAHGAQLRAVCNAFIRIDRAWLADCYRPDA